MGLSARKVKQRLVGSASSRNAAWLNDASLPGQRMLAQMGWKAGQGLGTDMQGMTNNLTLALKLDNKGIGASRHEREALAQGKSDIWVGAGGDLGNLFERLNAAATAQNEVASGTQKEDGNDASTTATIACHASSDQKKRKREEGTETKEERKRRKKEERFAKAARKEEKKRSKKAKELDGKKDIEKDKGKEKESEKKKKGGKDENDKKGKKNKKDKKGKKSGSSRRKTSLQSSSSSSSSSSSEDEDSQTVLRPVRLAHRAKFLRAKRMVGTSAISVNEILGISSGQATPNISGSSTPVAGKSYPGPGGSLIPLVDLASIAANEIAQGLEPTSQPSSDSEAIERNLREGSKFSAKAAAKSSESEEARRKKTQKEEKEKKGKKKEKEKDSKIAELRGEDSTGSSSDAKKKKSSPQASTPTDAENMDSPIGTNAQNLSVHEYLSRKLMLRKAAIARKKKEEADAIWSRAANVGA